MHYELVNLGSGNVLGTFESQGDALAHVAALLDVHGGDADALPALGLARVENNRATLLLEEDEVIARARDGSVMRRLISRGEREPLERAPADRPAADEPDESPGSDLGTIGSPGTAGERKP
jgi:hypothetical protein